MPVLFSISIDEMPTTQPLPLSLSVPSSVCPFLSLSPSLVFVFVLLRTGFSVCYMVQLWRFSIITEVLLGSTVRPKPPLLCIVFIFRRGTQHQRGHLHSSPCSSCCYSLHQLSPDLFSHLLVHLLCRSSCFMPQKEVLSWLLYLCPFLSEDWTSTLRCKCGFS